MVGIFCTALLIAAGSAVIAAAFPGWCKQEVLDYFDVLPQNMKGKSIVRLSDLTDCKKVYKEMLYIMRYFIMRCGLLLVMLFLCFKRRSCLGVLFTGLIESLLYTISAIMIFSACSRVSFSVWFLIGLLPESMISLCIYRSFQELWHAAEIRFNGKLLKPGTLYSMSPYLHCRIVFLLVICCLFEGFFYKICT